MDPEKLPKEIKVTNKTELQLIIWPDNFLRFQIEGFTEEQVKTPLVRNTVGAMIRGMYKHFGVGMAAQQMGVPQAMFVMDPHWVQTGKRKPRYFINPEIIEVEGKAIEMARPGEGCLSLPYGYRQPVPRASRVLLKWRDLDWVEHEEWFEDMEAIVVQHEIDHLFGVLFVDRLSRLKQDMFKRKARGTRRRYEKSFKQTMKHMRKKFADPVAAAKRFEADQREKLDG
jgi:peptide deformylase